MGQITMNLNSVWMIEDTGNELQTKPHYWKDNLKAIAPHPHHRLFCDWEIAKEVIKHC